MPLSLVRIVFFGFTAFALSKAAHADQTVKIGNILALTGAGAEVGHYLQQAETLYIKLHTKDLPPGVHIELITRDDASKPDDTKRLAQELIVRDHVQMIAGITLSPQAFAIASAVTEAKIPTVLLNATTGSITRASPYFVRFSNSNWQVSYEIGVWAGQHGIKTAYTIAADYAAGIDNEAAFVRGFKDNGGTIIGSDHTPITTTDYLPYMQRVKLANPNSLFFFEIAGTANIATLKAYAAADLRSAGVQLIGTGDSAPDDEMLQTGPIAEGIVDGSLYTTSLKTPQSDAFVKDWQAEYGPNTLPTFESVGAWNGMAGIFAVVKKLGDKATGDAAMAVFKTYKDPDAPQGPISIDPETRDIVQNVYLCRVQKVGDRYENVPFDTMKDVKDPWKVLNPG